MPVIDLSDWSYRDRWVVELLGDFDLHWGVLATPQDFAAGTIQSRPLLYPFPSVWDVQRQVPYDIKSNFYGTYRVRLRIPQNLLDDKSYLRLQMPPMPGPYRLWVDGQIAIENGQVATNRRQEKPAFGAFHFDFLPRSEFVEIILATSNFHFVDGGSWSSIKLSERTRAETRQRIMFGMDCFIVSTILIMTIYHFGIYFMRRRNIEALLFSCLGLCVIIRSIAVSLNNSDLNYRLSLGLGYEFLKMLEYTSVFAIAPLTYSFYRRIYPQDYSSFLEKWFAISCGCLVLTTFFMPVRIYGHLLGFFHVNVLFCIACGGVSMIRSFNKKRRGIFLFLLANFFYLSFAVHDILMAKRLIPVGFYLLPLGLFTLILFQAFTLARIYTDNYTLIEQNQKSIDDLNKNLQIQHRSLEHSFQQLAKIVYAHQVGQIKRGMHLESTMPTLPGEACVICFDIIGSSTIQHVQVKSFMRNVFRRCNELMMEGYDGIHLKARAYRIKEMGDGFLCSVGYPFEAMSDSIVLEAYNLSRDFARAFQEEAKKLDYSRPIYFGIGIVVDTLVGFYPQSGTMEYDLYGKAIILATRYEAMRKAILNDYQQGSIFVLQERFYESLPRSVREQFTAFPLVKNGIEVRDDPGATVLYYRILLTHESEGEATKQVS